jgi:hypothetical protein
LQDTHVTIDQKLQESEVKIFKNARNDSDDDEEEEVNEDDLIEDDSNVEDDDDEDDSEDDMPKDYSNRRALPHDLRDSLEPGQETLHFADSDDEMNFEEDSSACNI